MGWLFLAIAITTEIIATTTLRQSQGFTVLLPSAVTAVGYVVAFWMLSLALRTIDLGIAYAIWAGVGTAIVAAIGIVVFQEPNTVPKAVGILMIIGGVALLNVSGGTH